ncbi:MAG TPA: hypothetical protein VJM75_01690 [Acidimicrobiales bacterium]|nr:hypothetical protein [Acidimicrobiales bacterium]
MSEPAAVVPGQIELLPADPTRWGGPAAVPAGPIKTQGRIEFAVRCDGENGCGHVHRHVSPGVRTAPCGATYTVPDPNATEESPP